MASDRTRASDTERERVAERLREAAAAGRITVDELDERSALAYAAVTRAELAGLLDDLPAPRRESAAQPRRKLPRVPGRFAFTASWRGPADPRKAGADILEFLSPFFHAYGYDLIDRTPDRLVFARRYQPFWTILVSIFFFPLGLLALLARGDERIAVDMSEREGYTLTVVQGVAPLRVRRALAELED
ncbi:DUF1707 domain-containing protein [Solirubrobacter ginsenosidimutans]|uniref:DUF1707 domain-containing protein n=1 Tax=Solirubrobacter ginsenosidimutans TaxID=490573 RepID=A0A9X3RYA3_9ACTN|nr:DUF1707 domain-containing protein [Solirubrobacter ginsenosidimutans]MDA0158954.1 DUF1707 domain-containing protein [Solirubrobacter ginsenosidimutans]